MAKRKKSRMECPTSVIIIGLLLLVMGGLTILSRDPVSVVVGLLSITTGILMLVGEKWGWCLAVVFCTVEIVGYAAHVVPVFGDVVGLMMAVVVLVLLMLKDARRWFGI